jgi:hypothetical protein
MRVKKITQWGGGGIFIIVPFTRNDKQFKKSEQQFKN